MSQTTLDTIVSCEPTNENESSTTTTIPNSTEETQTKKKKHSLVEWIIAIACIIVLVICFILFFSTETITITSKASNISTTDLYNKSSKFEICNSTECFDTATIINQSMDLSIQPCDDFYEFVCGNFLKETQIPEDKVQVNEFIEVDEKLKSQIKNIFDDYKPTKNEQVHSLQLPYQLYKACMNKSLIETRGLEPMINLANTIGGGWPVVIGNEWNETKWNLIDIIEKFRQNGFGYEFLFEFSILADVKNNTKRIIDIDQAKLGINREYLIQGLQEKNVKAYFDYMVDLAIAFGAPKNDKKKVELELQESLDFEIQLANISLPKEERRNSSVLYNPITIENLSKNMTAIDWLKCINSILPNNIHVNSSEIITISVPQYLNDLNELLLKTSKRVIANYMMWRIHELVGASLTDHVRKIQLKFLQITSGQTTEIERWKECIDVTQYKLDIGVAALYVRKYFQKNAKTEAENMVAEIQDVFNQTLKQVEWMDKQTREAAILKLKDMGKHIGYPNELDDNKYIEKYYEKLELDSNRYFESMLNITKFKLNYQYSKLRNLVNKTSWERHSEAADVNAYYDAVENSIQFPAGILQGKFFSAERPKYMNYGAIGFVIGHEITHGFDDRGRQFDSNGNLVDWWQEDTVKGFLKKANCIIDQYSKFNDSLTGLTLNGINTQGESIADNGGVKTAYLAYLNWVEKNGPEQILPGLDYTPQQMFWISAALTWCSVTKPEAQEILIQTAPHPPSNFRINGALSNRKEFSADFQCPIGSPMNPLQKCEVW